MWLTGGDNNVFVQVGLVVLMGLACKNAILIVEFARELEMQGKGIVASALEACRLRLRPIVMTSVAFIAGTVPLVFSHGAGAEVRSVTGITVFAGMLGVTLFGLFLTPVFYVALRKLANRPLVSHDDPAHDAGPAHTGHDTPHATQLCSCLLYTSRCVEETGYEVSFPGLNPLQFTNTPNSGVMFLTLEPFGQRHRTAKEINDELNQKIAGIQEGFTFALMPPPIQGLGNGSGYSLFVEDRANLGYGALQSAVQSLSLIHI